MLLVKLFGPPGTGKTTSLVNEIKLFEKDAHRIAMISLTRATKKAFREVLIKQNVDLPWQNCRTMHSWAYKALKELKDKKDIIILETQPHILKECSLEVFKTEIRDNAEIEDLSHFLEDMQYSSDPTVALFQAFTKLRTSWDLQNTFPKHVVNFVKKEGQEFGMLEPEFFFKTFEKYQKWKKQKGVYDYADLLMLCLKDEINPFQTIKNGLILIVDEVQDLYPLAFRVLQKHMKNFNTVILAGDDDQTIFSFTGAKPEYFLNLEGYEVVLEQSYRLPRKIYEYAIKIINKNKIRKFKQFYPNDTEGQIDVILYENLIDFLDPQKDTLLLARTNFIVQEYVQLLEEFNVPYKLILNNVKPSEKIPRFLQIHESLKNGQDIPAILKLSELPEKFLSEIVYPYVRMRLNVKRLKKEEKELIKEGLFKREPLKAKKFSIPVREILTKNLEEISTNLDKNQIRKWRARLSKIEEWLDPKIKVGTIHSAKGMEAERVIIDPRITAKIEEEMTTQEGLEAERRVWYVAVTRAKKELYVIDPPLGSFYRSPTFPLPEI